MQSSLHMVENKTQVLLHSQHNADLSSSQRPFSKLQRKDLCVCLQKTLAYKWKKGQVKEFGSLISCISVGFRKVHGQIATVAWF